METRRVENRIIEAWLRYCSYFAKHKISVNTLEHNIFLILFRYFTASHFCSKLKNEQFFNKLPQQIDPFWLAKGYMFVFRAA